MLPKTQITIQDILTKERFDKLKCKQVNDINPRYHLEIHTIYAKDFNGHLNHCGDTLTKVFNSIITEQWTENPDADFLDTNIVIQCIKKACEFGFDNPYFTPKILVQCMFKNDKTKDLWT